MLIINPNFAVDRTISLGELLPGTVHRTGPAVTSLGGKGVNVARVIRAFGAVGPLLGFIPEVSADQIARLAAAEGATLDGVRVASSVRSATVMVESSGRVTVFNEPGPTVESADWERLVGLVATRMSGHDTVVCSGSLPPGSPHDGYGRIVAAARRAGLRSVVDASGAALASVLSSEPDVVSPNLAEAEALIFGSSAEPVEPTGDDVRERALSAARTLVQRGARHAIVSAGSYGAAFSSPDETCFFAAPAVRVVNPIGAGDSLVAGLVHGLEGGQPWGSALPFALAVASASCELPVAGRVDVDRAIALSGIDWPDQRPGASDG